MKIKILNKEIELTIDHRLFPPLEYHFLKLIILRADIEQLREKWRKNIKYITSVEQGYLFLFMIRFLDAVRFILIIFTALFGKFILGYQWLAKYIFG